MASRYDTILKIAAGGMATVYVGTVRGALGFRQLVALKKPHPHLLADDSYRSELIAEARLASMIHHANVVDVRDVEAEGDSIVLVMDYIEGASLGDLLVAASRAGKRVPTRVIVRIVLDALAGLGAAHDLVDERGRTVGLVHRDISPQNILVGVDGSTRVTDFGVAKFKRRNNESSDGSLKGKIAYMAPEYLRGEKIDRRFDIFATGVVLWEGSRIASTLPRRQRGRHDAPRPRSDARSSARPRCPRGGPRYRAREGSRIALPRRGRHGLGARILRLGGGARGQPHRGRREREGALRRLDRRTPHARAEPARARALIRVAHGRERRRQHGTQPRHGRRCSGDRPGRQGQERHADDCARRHGDDDGRHARRASASSRSPSAPSPSLLPLRPALSRARTPSPTRSCRSRIRQRTPSPFADRRSGSRRSRPASCRWCSLPSPFSSP